MLKGTVFLQRHFDGWSGVLRKISRILSVLALFVVLASHAGASETSEQDAQTDELNHVSAILVASDGEKTRLVLDMSEEVEARTFLLPDPYRLVIDLPETDFTLTPDAIRHSGGVLKKLRYGRLDDGVSRLILEADDALSLIGNFTVPETSDSPVRLVLDLKRTTDEAFKTALVEQNANTGRRAKQRERTSKQALIKKAADPKGDRALPASRLRIVIDPGHGGIDGGATAVGRSGILEKDLVLAFAKSLAQALGASGEYDILLTRDRDKFVSLSRRVEIAREFEADLFISIHADSFPQDRTVRGATVYTLSDTASDSVAAFVAEQENKSDLLAGFTLKEAPDDVVDILLDLTTRETSDLSVVFARHIIGELRSKIRFFKRPHQTGAFRVLKVPDIPSALIELGYLSNNRDVNDISSAEWRERTALEMAAAIARYFKITKPANTR